MRGGLKFVKQGSGVQYVMIYGMTPMRVLFVHNWATKDKVGDIFNTVSLLPSGLLEIVLVK